jgi:hypothetical protein
VSEGKNKPQKISKKPKPEKSRSSQSDISSVSNEHPDDLLIDPKDLVGANDESDYETDFRPYKRLKNGKVIWAKWFGFKAFPMNVKRGA